LTSLSVLLPHYTHLSPTDIYPLSLHDALPIYFIEPKLREVLPQHQREDADERQDREDDPEDAHAQVPAVQPFGGSDLLTLGAHSDRKSTRLNSSHGSISYAVFCLKKKTIQYNK